MSTKTIFYGLYRYRFVLPILLLLFVGIVTATYTAAERIKCTLYKVCDLINTILPLIGFTLFVLAGVAYAIGNFFGAEMKAKATSWAMMCVTGAVVSLLIFALGPMIIKGMTGTSLTGGCADIGAPNWC